MRIFKTVSEWINFRNTLPEAQSLGFVPSMGNLHAGHLSLFKISVSANDNTVSSLYINPKQFNNSTDFEYYPRTLEADLQLMEQAGVDYCLLPTDEDMYADGYTYQIHENHLCQVMEGKQRAGHFNGVLTIVLKLLQLTRPQNAYFGEKDYQQYLLIHHMVQAFFMKVNIIPCPTIREESGLAYSSRNNRLSQEHRALAAIFAQLFHQGSSCSTIIKALTAKGIAVDYIEEHLGRRFAAVTLGEVRLIDNYAL